MPTPGEPGMVALIKEFPPVIGTFPHRRGPLMSVTHHRRLAGAAGAALLTLAVAGCSGLGRTAVGTLTYETVRENTFTVSNPLVTGCHRLGLVGAAAIVNRTMVDIIVYPTPDCSGDESIYVATTTSDLVAPGARPWRSYSLVH